MDTRVCRRRAASAIAIASGLAVFSNIGLAQLTYPIVHQTFDEGGYTFQNVFESGNNATVNGAIINPPPGNSQLLTWYNENYLNYFNLVSDPAINSGLALSYLGVPGAGPPAFMGSGAFANNAVIGPSVGDEVTAQVTFDIPNNTVNGGSFRFGLFNDNGTPVTAPFYFPAYDAYEDDYGYSAYMGLGPQNTVNGDSLSLFSETNVGPGVLLYDLNYDYRLTSQGLFNGEPAPYISDGNAHTALFTLTRTSTGVNVAYSVDGTTYFSGPDTNPDPTTVFNEFEFRIDSTDQTFDLDNIFVNEVDPNLTWDNAGASSPADGQTWDGANNNWNNGSVATVYGDGSPVIFNDSNNGKYAITLSSTVSPGSVTVNNNSGNYSFSGSGTIIDTGSFTKSGTGMLTLGTGLTAGAMSITSGAVRLAANTTVGSGTATSNINISSLSITGNGVLDITNNHIIIDYTTSDPMSAIYAYLQSGYNNGGWNGVGPSIISSAAAAENATSGLKYGIGFADGSNNVVAGLSSGQIELKYTLLGDANLDGTVNGSDFSILAANFGLGDTNWDQGNFLYGSSVNGSDFSALAANFGQGDGGAAVGGTAADWAALDAFAAANGINLTSVPEPVSMGLLTGVAAFILARSRRARN